VVRTGRVAEELISLSKNIKRVAALLSDARECEFIGVAIPEKMALAETVRLTETLVRLKVPMRRLLVNNVLPETAAAACEFCAARRREQQRVIKSFRTQLGQVEQLFIAPQQPAEIRGAERLRAHFAGWREI
ncbi:MAG: hypothetical protein JO360_02515, partial [Acidobacteria bacterium]|nr:hypothetical protein [Acidobacteriota bacterium]